MAPHIFARILLSSLSVHGCSVKVGCSANSACGRGTGSDVATKRLRMMLVSSTRGEKEGLKGCESGKAATAAADEEEAAEKTPVAAALSPLGGAAPRFLVDRPFRAGSLFALSAASLSALSPRSWLHSWWCASAAELPLFAPCLAFAPAGGGERAAFSPARCKLISLFAASRGTRLAPEGGACISNHLGPSHADKTSAGLGAPPPLEPEGRVPRSPSKWVEKDGAAEEEEDEGEEERMRFPVQR